MLMRSFSVRREVGLDAPLDDELEHQRDEREAREQRRDRERGCELVLVVEDLDVQRHRVGLAADVARDDADRAELAHRARVAEDHAVEQRPLDVGQRDAPKDLPAVGAEHTRGFFLLGALCLHQRDQLAGDEREGDEDGGEDDAGQREDDLQVVVAQPIRRTSLAGRTRARRSGPRSRGCTENGRSISVSSRFLPRKSNLAMHQAAAMPNTRFKRHRDAGGDQSQLDCRELRRGR
jgi:hypothetical protein